MTIEIKGLDDALKKLDRLNKPAVFKTPMTQSLNYLQRQLKQKVPKAPGAFTALATDGQRRAYWAKVTDPRTGKINPNMHGPGGYKRTGSTARGWTIKITNQGRTGEIGNQMPGAPYVYGAPDQRPLSQQPFHKRSGWPRVDLVAKKAEKTIVGFFQKAYEKALK
jgi:hypothetical protein